MQSPIRGIHEIPLVRVVLTCIGIYRGTLHYVYMCIRICGDESKVQNLPLETTTPNLYDYKVIAVMATTTTTTNDDCAHETRGGNA